MTNIPQFMPVISSGSHITPQDGACFMEYVSLIAGETWTDMPMCTHPFITGLVHSMNDGGDPEKHAILLDTMPRIMASGTSNPDAIIDMLNFLPNLMGGRRASSRTLRFFMEAGGVVDSLVAGIADRAEVVRLGNSFADVISDQGAALLALLHVHESTHSEAETLPITAEDWAKAVEVVNA